MKKYLLLLLSVTIIFTSCKKDSNPTTPTPPKDEYYTVTQTIDAQTGGTIITPDNTVITIPGDALTSTQKITVETIDPTTNNYSDISTVGKIYKFTPDNTIFDKPIKVEVIYDESKISAGNDEADITAYTFEDGEYVSVNTEIDQTNNKVTFYTTHFSDYVLGTPTGFSPNGPRMSNVNMTVKNGKVYAQWRLDNLFAAADVWWSDRNSSIFLPFTLNEMMHNYLYYTIPAPGWVYSVSLEKYGLILNSEIATKKIVFLIRKISGGGNGYEIEVFVDRNKVNTIGLLSNTECATAVSGEGLSVEMCDVSLLSQSSKYQIRVSGMAGYFHSDLSYDNYYKQYKTGKSTAEYPVNTLNKPPTPAGFENPKTGSKGLQNNVKLTWGCADPDGDPLTFDVYCDNSNPPITKVASVITTKYHQLTGLTLNKTYYWKIIAKDNNGASSTSPIWNFITGSGNPPPKPTLVFPTDNLLSTSINPKLEWTNVTDATKYSVEVAYDQNFQNIYLQSSGILTNSKQLSNLSYNKDYYWRVKAENNFGNSGWSSPYKFTTMIKPVLASPSIPTFISPINGATIQPENAEFKWSNVTNGQTYGLQISTNSNFTSFIFNSSNIPTNSKTVTTLSGQTVYYWRICAFNGNVSSGWSQYQSFTTSTKSNNAPNPPVIIYPYDNTAGYPLSLTLAWDATDPDNDPIAFDVYFGTTNPPPKVTSSRIQANTYNVSGLAQGT
ncbi:MAG: hypothetical protein EPN88_01195, partial [Bacteroidetes bacterium]